MSPLKSRFIAYSLLVYWLFFSIRLWYNIFNSLFVAFFSAPSFKYPFPLWLSFLPTGCKKFSCCWFLSSLSGTRCMFDWALDNMNTWSLQFGFWHFFFILNSCFYSSLLIMPRMANWISNINSFFLLAPFLHFPHLEHFCFWMRDRHAWSFSVPKRDDIKVLLRPSPLNVQNLQKVVPFHNK